MNCPPPQRHSHHHWHRRWGVPPFGLRRQIFWSLIGAMIAAGAVTFVLSRWLTPMHVGGVVAACALLSLWLASGRLARRIVLPLERLVEVVQRFGQGDYSARTQIPLRARGEVAHVARAVDTMAARIEQQMKEERELLAAVSHELRTPLARIRVLTDLAREGQLPALDDIDREIADIDYLVANLLARSRLEFGTLAKKQLRLPDAAGEALDRAGLDASLLLIEGERANDPVTADPTLLHRAIANLIDNAQRHGKGVERVEVHSTASGVSVEVLDRGPGFAQPDPAQRFKPFAAETGGTRGQGLGLGLSLIQRIVANHEGRVWAENRADGGARVGFELPLATTSGTPA